MGRVAPLAQRAAYGYDGLELHQINDTASDDDFPPPLSYAPYLRRPQALLPDVTASASLQHDYYSEPAPHFVREAEIARREAMTAQHSREILRETSQAARNLRAPEMRAATLVETLEQGASSQVWRVQQPNVRFTRTPESSITRRKAEEETRRRAEEEAKARVEEAALRVRETQLVQAQCAKDEKPRVRYARTPDKPLAMGSRQDLARQALAPELPPFGAFAAMGARFSFHFGGVAEPRGRSIAEAVVRSEKAEKIRVRVKAEARPAQAQEFSAPPVVPPPAPPKARIKIKGVASPAPEPAFYQPLELDMLTEPPEGQDHCEPDELLEVNSDTLEKTLEDFGVRGDILNAHPGPVVTLYEFEPAPGIKSSRVIGLADDIARSMSAVSARVAVVPGRNAIGIELPNPRRETVYLRELVASPDFTDSKHKLAIALGKTIGGEPVIVDLAKMPHLLVAGTTGSGKSVAINTMILSLLYRLKPQDCRLIMVDPKMLELSVYDGIPHLLTPVVTDPKKAVVALKWAVREMEDRYKKMSKLGVRNIDGFNARVKEAREKGEVITRAVQTGFDRETGEAIFGQEQMDLTSLPYIVVIVDEMADLMMVAGKEIEGAIQRLAQMARAAGIHLIMATQRPSVDVITGTIKANFPTRISFQVTSKIDSRTILGEMGAEQLLGQGDMLYMAGGGRISRVHGPFVSDEEVEKVVAHLKMQGQPEYLDAVTVEEGAEDEDGEAAPASASEGDEPGDLYDRAVAIVLRDKKCSTSYVQRRLSVGYNKAASLVERMEKEGVVGAANHAGKRQILVGGGVDRGAFDLED